MTATTRLPLVLYHAEERGRIRTPPEKLSQGPRIELSSCMAYTYPAFVEYVRALVTRQ